VEEVHCREVVEAQAEVQQEVQAVEAQAVEAPAVEISGTLDELRLVRSEEVPRSDYHSNAAI
jgi:hypothetical protein